MTVRKHIMVTKEEKEVIDEYHSDEFNERVSIGYALMDACRQAMSDKNNETNYGGDTRDEK